MDVNVPQNLYDPPNNTKHCYIVNITAGHSIWQTENPLSQALPLLVVQLSYAILVTRTLYYLLRPFRVPRIVAEILGGVMMGPSALGRWDFFSKMFPLRSVLTIETVAYWALTCHMFLVGLEMDMLAVLRTGKKAMMIAASCVIIPFCVGNGAFWLFNYVTKDKDYNGYGWLIGGVTLTITGFPVVARVLADLKLLHTEIGRLAMSVSIVNDLVAWIFLVIVRSTDIVSDLGKNNVRYGVFAVCLTAAFAMFCVYVVRPLLARIIRLTWHGNNFSEYYLCCVLVSVSLFAIVSELFGTHSIVGAFIYGLIMPNRVLACALEDKFEDFISGYLLPLFFATCGVKFKIEAMKLEWVPVALLVIILSCGAKILSTFAASFFYDMSQKEFLSLGVVMNSKGILSIVILVMALQEEWISDQSYVVMILAILTMTGAVGPIMATIYRPAKRLSQYMRRTIQKARSDAQFRILACFQDFRNVSSMINLLDCSNPTKQSPLCVFALHLVELTGRASAMLIVHSKGKSSSNRRNHQSEQIISALETYENLTEMVSIQPLTALSPFATMHEDLCSVAEDKQIAFLILPFHKLPSQEGKLEDEGNTSFRGVNVNVLSNAPCTVGIFVDRGFGAVNHAESNLSMRHIAMFFIGGPDDREALAYAWRMAGSHHVSLTVVRFLPGVHVEEIEPIDLPAGDANRLLTSISYTERQRRCDDEYIEEFRLKSAGEQFITYQEKVVNNSEEIITALKELHHIYDLYVVGKGQGIISPLTAGLMDWCEYAELGAMGDLLVTSSFAQGSVLVLQQYADTGNGDIASMLDADDISGHGRDHFGSWQSSAAAADDDVLEMEPFAKRQGKDGIDD